MNTSSNIALIDQIRTVLGQALNIPVDEISPTLAFGDLPQWDSLGHMEVMMRLEEYFEIEINADTIAGLTSVPLIHNHIINSSS